MKFKNIAIIPARGGSKRIPRKNIKGFNGKPIIYYSIRAALATHCFKEVMVSTDDSEIAKVAKKYGAHVPFLRSASTANDHAHLAEVVLEVLRMYRLKGILFDNACCILPTAPFVSSKKIQYAYRLLKEKKVDSVFPVVRYSYPIERALRMQKKLVTMIHPQNYTVRSQDLKPAFHDAGQFYWANVKKFQKQKKLIAKKSYAIEVPESETQDIDTFEDWKLAEFKYKLTQHL